MKVPVSRKATRESVELEKWQIDEIKNGLDEADRVEFASDEEVEQVRKRWTGGHPTGNLLIQDAREMGRGAV